MSSLVCEHGRRVGKCADCEVQELQGDVSDLEEENAMLRKAFSKVKEIALQEKEWRIEDSECGNCEVRESLDSLSYKIDQLLKFNAKESDQ